jgi:hypothetical protein
MKVVVGMVLMLVLLLIVTALVQFVRAKLSEHSIEHGKWELDENSDGEQVVVTAYRPGQERLLIGQVAFASEDFDSQLYELRAKGRYKVQALNEGRKGLKA